jgi:hypothetical protein
MNQVEMRFEAYFPTEASMLGSDVPEHIKGKCGTKVGIFQEPPMKA